MTLPTDFGATLAQIQDRGILEEGPDRIHQRMVLAAEGVGTVEVRRDLSVAGWVDSTIKSIKQAVYEEICDKEKRCLRSRYESMLDHALTPAGIQALASAVGKIVASVNPALFVSSFLIYISVWLLKVGVSHWCSLPFPTSAAATQ